MTPVQYSAANQVLVDAFERLPQNLQLAAYWSDDAVDPVRAEIKGHYIAVQKYICVYCGRSFVSRLQHREGATGHRNYQAKEIPGSITALSHRPSTL